MIHRIGLLWSKILNSSIKDKNVSEEIKIIYVYRYLSWALTSFVYLTGRPYSIIFFKLGVIVSLLISSKIITDLYIKYKGNKGMLRKLVLIETLGITLLLLPTGGLVSPFIWYALNPTLVAASYLPAYFYWMNLVFYLLTGSTMSYVLFNPNNNSIVVMFMNNSNLTLVFILITLAVQLLANLTKKLYIQTKALHLSNFQKQESIEHIMSLYQIIEALNNHSTKNKLFETLAIYTGKLTKSDLSFFWLPNTKEEGAMIKTSKDLNQIELQEIQAELEQLGLKENRLQVLQEIRIVNKDFVAIPILSPTTYFGIIAVEKKSYANTDEIEQRTRLLEFLAGLSAVTLERFNLEDIEDHLIVMEEQNRIANEIHDSVSQRLFSISYAIHGILGRLKTISSEELKEYLIEVNESSNLSMQELRNSIYRLSSKKKGEKSLKVTLKAFLDSISKLHNIIIDFEVQGDESLLPLPLKKGITRIIREGCGNAIRHGKCQQIYLDIEIHREFISLSIIDDGKGFILNKEVAENQKGLGISNIKNLVHSFNGNIEINSEIGKGTEIHIMLLLGEGFSNVQQGGFAI